MADYACIVLPFPPTTNNLFAGKARRFPSRAYKDWKAEAWRALQRQLPIAAFDAPVEIVMRLGRPDNRRRDIANYEKAVSDLLVSAGILADDSLIERLVMEWARDVRGVQVEIKAFANGLLFAQGRVA